MYVVSTPIGNMGDFSFRAVEVLKAVAVVLAEDTRHSRHLLDRYDIATQLVAYHEHNEAKTTPRLVERLLGGESIALISDAGTPLLSDPGGRLVRAAVEADVPVSAVPGASALLAALVSSGLELDRFTFYGFLPRKGGERREAVSDIVQQLQSWKRVGFVLVVASGLLLAWAEPQKLYRSPAFWIKIALLVLVGVHALVFSAGVYRNTAKLDTAVTSQAKLAAAISLILWAGLILSGRLIAFDA